MGDLLDTNIVTAFLKNNQIIRKKDEPIILDDQGISEALDDDLGN